MSAALFARAHALGGAFAWADAADAGLRPSELQRLVSGGQVVDVGPRAYVLTEALEACDTDELRHRLHTLAVLRSFDGRVAASHHSAAALFMLPFWRVSDDTIHVARCTGRTSRRRDSLVIHEAWPVGSLITSPATGMTSVNAALAVIGTAMVDGEEAGIVAADAALRLGLTSAAELDDWLGRLRRRPGIAEARRAVALADGRSESVGETRTRLILQAMPDLPEITPQFEFVDEAGEVWARSDFLVGTRLVVEFDGRVKYRAEGNSRAVEEIVWAEKRREDRIRRTGRLVERVVWHDLDHPRQVQARVRAALRTIRELGLDAE